MPTIVVGPLGSLQVGEQTALGTPQTQPALELMGQGVRLVQSEPQSRFDELTGRGVAANVLDPVTTDNVGTLTHPQPLTAEALLLPLHACFGDVTPTTPSGATNARQWLWQFDPRANQAPNFYTFTCVRRDDSETPNAYPVQGQDGFLQTLGITWDGSAAGQPVGTVTSTYMLNRITEGGAVAVATADQDFNPILPNMRLTIDDTWAEMIGATPTLAADVYSVDIQLATGLSRVPRAHGDAAYGYDLVNRASRVMLTMTLGVYVDITAAGLYRKQREMKAARARVFAALHGVGGEIESGHNYEIAIGGCFTHLPDSLTEQDGTLDSDGRQTMTIRLQSMFDSTGTVNRNVFARVINGEAAFP